MQWTECSVNVILVLRLTERALLSSPSLYSILFETRFSCLSHHITKENSTTYHSIARYGLSRLAECDMLRRPNDDLNIQLLWFEKNSTTFSNSDKENVRVRTRI
jgi:hypothetical protein